MLRNMIRIDIGLSQGAVRDGSTSNSVISES